MIRVVSRNREKRTCPLDGKRIRVFLTDVADRNVGMICLCIEGVGRCTKDGRYRCIFPLTE